MRALLLVAVLSIAALAGCASPSAPSDPADPDGSWAQPPRDEGGLVSWASPEDARIRPGIQVVSETGQCTSNFVFTSPDNASVYLGLAAHCVEGLPLGSKVDIGGVATGTLAYSSWATMEEVGEKDQAALDANDFALILVPAEARALVSPSMRHFGGPIGLADSSQGEPGDKVLTYGNSGLRGQVEPASWHEGVIVSTTAWTTTAYTATPGIPGDSGSGALTGDGRALGIVVTLTVAPLAGSNGITHLDLALGYALEKAGIDARLATAELLTPGVLPPT